MRLFIAIEFPDSVKAELEKGAILLRGSCIGGTFSQRDNYHITLAFLGEVPPERVGDITDAMDSCVCRPIPLSIGPLGSFGHNGGGVIWRAIRAPGSLAQLRQRLAEALRTKGFALEEEKEFRPHLTIARQAVLHEGARLDALSQMLPDLEYTAASITLMCSGRIGGRLTYTPVYQAAFRE